MDESGPGRGDHSVERRALRRRVAREKLNIIKDPLRLAIVSHLSRGAASAAETAEEVGAPAKEVRYLLRRMREAGLVEVAGRGSGPRARENLYSVDPASLVLEESDLAHVSQGALEEAHIRLLRLLFREALESAQSGRLSARQEHTLIRFPISVDEEGWNEVSEIHDQALREVIKAQERCFGRLAQSGEEPVQGMAAIFFFERADAQGVET